MKALKTFIIIATLFGINVLFFILVDPWEGSLWLAQLGMLGFINVLVGFIMHWLFTYSQTPEIPENTIDLRKPKHKR